MKKLILAATAMALALPATANAAADVTINFGATNLIPANNDFQAQLNGLGLFEFATVGASLFLNGPASITFEFLGSESGFFDTFSTSGGLTLTETSSGVINNFAAPVLIGTQFFAGGSLASLLNFTSNFGIPATVGDDGFGIFLGAKPTSGLNYTTFYLGYDDEVRRQDDNHDDFIIRATVSSPVPEPATWAMALVGFAAIGRSMRSRRRVNTSVAFS
jgi:hypothetical protein